MPSGDVFFKSMIPKGKDGSIVGDDPWVMADSVRSREA
jgi:hypothetical protein